MYILSYLIIKKCTDVEMANHTDVGMANQIKSSKVQILDYIQ